MVKKVYVELVHEWRILFDSVADTLFVSRLGSSLTA